MIHLDDSNQPLSQIIINQQVEEELENLQKELSSYLVVSFFHEDFLIEHAKEITKAAYVAESQTKYIIVAGLSFNNVVQNSLLKLLEEPPTHIRFIILIPSKSILLPTVLSRLPLLKRKEREIADIDTGISFRQFDLAMLNGFAKAHERIAKRDAKYLLEALFKQASQELGQLTIDQLDAFDKGYRLLDLNGRPHTIFINVLLHFLPGSLR